MIEQDPHIVGPYFLWRLLIDKRHQRRGYGAAALATDRIVDGEHVLRLDLAAPPTSVGTLGS